MLGHARMTFKAFSLVLPRVQLRLCRLETAKLSLLHLRSIRGLAVEPSGKRHAGRRDRQRRWLIRESAISSRQRTVCSYIYLQRTLNVPAPPSRTIRRCGTEGSP
jgi:hypothetical protein